jgi:hypothetical protein
VTPSGPQSCASSASLAKPSPRERRVHEHAPRDSLAKHRRSAQRPHPPLLGHRLGPHRADPRRPRTATPLHCQERTPLGVSAGCRGCRLSAPPTRRPVASVDAQGTEILCPAIRSRWRLPIEVERSPSDLRSHPTSSTPDLKYARPQVRPTRCAAVWMAMAVWRVVRCQSGSTRRQPRTAPAAECGSVCFPAGAQAASVLAPARRACGTNTGLASIHPEVGATAATSRFF